MRVGILGATGAVGMQMLACLEEQKIPVDEVRLLASERSEGKTFLFYDEKLVVQRACETSFKGLDVVLGAVSNTLAKEFYPYIQSENVLFIDNSSAFRLDEDVPLVIPEINGEDALKHQGIIANPNCSTIITLMAIAPIQKLSPIQTLIASTYQAVSGAGLKGMEELENQVYALGSRKPVETHVFPKQIAYNCIPWIGSLSEDGNTSEEMKMRNEGRKILHNPSMQVNCTCVRVPVMRCHSISVSLACQRSVSVEEAREAIAEFPGVVFMEQAYPYPLMATNQDMVYVGRLRSDGALKGGLSLFCCGDQIRKGAASNAVQILDYLLRHKAI